MGAALFYTYVWGWYTGFIRMPYFSIAGLLNTKTATASNGEGGDDAREVFLGIDESTGRELLRPYRLLTSLFVDESDERFPVEHFGFLTPQEARDEHINNYDKRFKAWYSRALGEFLQNVPPQYRQQ